MVWMYVSDWRRLPAELKVKERKVKRLKSSLKPKIPQRKKTDADASEIAKTLEVMFVSNINCIIN